jgi:hypothetical protein
MTRIHLASARAAVLPALCGASLMPGPENE